MSPVSETVMPSQRAWLDEEYYLKMMDNHEASIYACLSAHTATLLDSSPSIRIAELTEYNQTTQLGVMTNVGDFPVLELPEYFGESDGYTPEYVDIMLGAFRVLRDVVQATDVPETEDYEESQSGLISSLDYLQRTSGDIGTSNSARLYDGIERMAQATQGVIVDSPSYFSHRDPNPTNFLVSTHPTQGVNIIDWETSGLSRIGYDEGRLLTYFALNEPIQDYLRQAMSEQLTDEQQVYYWRVAAMRSYREIGSIITGRYDRQLATNNPDDPTYRNNKVRITDNLAKIADQALQEIETITG